MTTFVSVIGFTLVRKLAMIEGCGCLQKDENVRMGDRLPRMVGRLGLMTGQT